VAKLLDDLRRAAFILILKTPQDLNFSLRKGKNAGCGVLKFGERFDFMAEHGYPFVHHH
jgi:hypothetical protein